MRSPIKLVVCTLMLAASAGAFLVSSAQDSIAPGQAQPSTVATRSYKPQMTFDWASIRQSKIDRDRGYTVRGWFEPANSSHLSVENWGLFNLLSVAYPIFGRQFVGFENLPVDLQRAVFNIQARSDAVADRQLAALPKKELRLEQEHMVQGLLADRFSLKVHWETRDSPIYSLELIGSGKLRSSGIPPSDDELKVYGAEGMPPIYQKGDSRYGFEYVAHSATVQDIVETLGFQFGRPVVDHTGLTGKYDFDLKTYQTQDSDRGDQETNPWPPLETAIRDQLGLKLVRSHGPVDFLIIEHAEMPSPN